LRPCQHRQGQRFKSAAGRIVSSGIDSLVFSVHGPDARTHDALTRAPGSFDQLKKGLANLRALGFSGICGNTTVVKKNMAALPRVAAFYIKRGIRNVEYIFVDPNYGGAKNCFRALVPRISAAAPHMRRALELGRRAGFPGWRARWCSTRMLLSKAHPGAWAR